MCGWRLVTCLAVIISAGTLTLSAPSQSNASEDELTKLATGVAPQITRVRNFGKWREDETRGVYRGILVRRAPTKDKPFEVKFFLQWVSVSNTGTLSVLRTLSFPKLTTDGVNVTDFRYEKDPEGLVLFIDTLHPKTRDDITYELFLRAPDDYDLQPASN